MSRLLEMTVMLEQGTPFPLSLCVCCLLQNVEMIFAFGLCPGRIEGDASLPPPLFLSLSHSLSLFLPLFLYLSIPPSLFLSPSLFFFVLRK